MPVMDTGPATAPCRLRRECIMDELNLPKAKRLDITVAANRQPCLDVLPG